MIKGKNKLNERHTSQRRETLIPFHETVEDVEGERTTRFKSDLAVQDRLELANEVLKQRENVSSAQVWVLQLDRFRMFQTGPFTRTSSITETLVLSITVRVHRAVHGPESLLLQAVYRVRQRVKNLRIRVMTQQFETLKYCF